MKTFIISLVFAAVTCASFAQEFDSIPPFVRLTSIKVIMKGGEQRTYPCAADFCSLSSVFGRDSVTAILFSYEAKVSRRPEKVRYKTMVKGKDEVWSQPSGKRELLYERLSPGTYTLRVHACNSSALWTPKPFEFQFIIQ
jgi:hypothetical protein